MVLLDENIDLVDVSKSITIYVYRMSDGLFLYTHTGPTEYAIDDLGDDKDFTLRELPDESQVWYWLDDKWIQKEKTPEEPIQ